MAIAAKWKIQFASGRLLTDLRRPPSLVTFQTSKKASAPATCICQKWRTVSTTTTPISTSSPLDPHASYVKTDDSRHAIEYFQKYLEQQPNDLEVRWLLYLAYMTLGVYPSGVPATFLIPEAAFQSKQNIGRFADVAPAAGLNIFRSAGGVIVDDFDNDGLLDVMVSSMDNCDPIHFFHNNGDGTFSDRTKEAGLLNQLGGLNILQADYNNDGCMDFDTARRLGVSRTYVAYA